MPGFMTARRAAANGAPSAAKTMPGVTRSKMCLSLAWSFDTWE